MILQQQEKPFDDIPDIEADEEKLTLLGSVYTLMVEFDGRQLLDREDNAEKVDGIEPTADREPLYEYRLCHSCHCKDCCAFY